MIGIAAAIGATIALLAAAPRLFVGPTLYDRALAGNGVAVKAVLICAAAAVAFGRADFVDVAIALYLGLIVANVALFKLVRARTFQAPLARAGEDG